MPEAFIPIALSLLAAFFFALGAQFQNQGLPYMDSRTGATITISTAALIYILAAPFFLNVNNLFHPAVLIFILVGVFRPALSGNLALAGMRFLGPTIATTLTATSPLFGTALGIFWLGEALNWPTGIGTIIIVAAIMLLAKKDDKKSLNWPIWALALPIGAAIIRAFGHVLTKVGMESIPDVYLASFVGLLVSAFITLSLHKFRKNAPQILWLSKGTHWFMGASVCFSLAVIFLNIALYRGTVVQVVPIVAASPIFTLILSLAIFRREQITIRTLVAVCLVVPAVILIAVEG